MNECSLSFEPSKASVCRASICRRRMNLLRSMRAPLQTANSAVKAQTLTASSCIGSLSMLTKAWRHASTLAIARAVSFGNGLGVGRRIVEIHVGATSMPLLRKRLPTRYNRFRCCAAVVQLNSLRASRPSSRASNSRALGSLATPACGLPLSSAACALGWLASHCRKGRMAALSAAALRFARLNWPPESGRHEVC